MKIPTRSDLDACIAARLSGFPSQAVKKAAQAIFTLVNVGEGIPLDKNAAALFLDSFGLVPAGNPETLSHALIATASPEHRWIITNDEADENGITTKETAP